MAAEALLKMKDATQIEAQNAEPEQNNNIEQLRVKALISEQEHQRVVQLVAKLKRDKAKLVQHNRVLNAKLMRERMLTLFA